MGFFKTYVKSRKNSRYRGISSVPIQSSQRKKRAKRGRWIFLPSKIIESVAALRVYPMSIRYVILDKIVVPTCKAIECFFHHAAHPLPCTSSTKFIFELCRDTHLRLYRRLPARYTSINLNDPHKPVSDRSLYI